ncbi:MAG TPA: 16S rRNA (cytidine(1402)-2'-O)-methyltransferase [Solirubrobacteraceae bacterium]|nr:16S rRNA (cytidine(1402)-2'-O)-methyltransferase [Solirubrobacteraceae bacterium]
MSASSPGQGRLLICPTPLGNPGDITLRALDALRRADLVACEDTRRTGALLAAHDIDARLAVLNEHTERARAGEIAQRVAAGELVVLASDAGTPLLSDPGFTVVRACRDAGQPVEVLPGASAVTTALVASGLPCERFRFVGFLERSAGRLIEQLDADETTVAFESPRRLAATLAAIARADPGREVAVCRELTKVHEEVRRGAAVELAAHYDASPARGEVTLVVAPRARRSFDVERAGEALERLIDAGARPRAAAQALARLTGLRAKDLYDRRAGGE